MRVILDQMYHRLVRSQALGRLAPPTTMFLVVLCLMPVVAIPTIPSDQAAVDVFEALFEEFRSNTGEVLANTLFYTTAIMMAGIAAAVAGRGGMLNAGIEGQLCLGAFLTALIAHEYAFLPSLPIWGRCSVGMALAVLLPAATAAFAGWLRNARGIHEILTTLFLNFVLIGTITLVLGLDAVRDGSGSAQTRPVLDSMRWPNWFQSKLNPGLAVGAFVALAMWVLTRRTAFGLKLRAAGTNPFAFQHLGFSISRIHVTALALSGAIAGLTGWQHVLGAEWKYPEGFNLGYGWLGLGVAFTAGNSVTRVVWTSLLLGTVQALGVGLQQVSIPPDVVTLVQALALGISFVCFRWSDRIDPHANT